MQGKQSTLTGVAALLFAGGLILMFAALYRDAAHGGPLLWVGLTAAGRDDRLLVCGARAPTRRRRAGHVDETNGRAIFSAHGRTAQSRSAKGDRTRARILDEAVELASVQGLGALTIGPLAERLGLSKSGLFAHFRSKEALQVETLERAAELFRAEVTEPMRAEPDRADRLRGSVRALDRLAREFRPHRRLPDPGGGGRIRRRAGAGARHRGAPVRRIAGPDPQIRARRAAATATPRRSPPPSSGSRCRISCACGCSATARRAP